MKIIITVIASIFTIVVNAQEVSIANFSFEEEFKINSFVKYENDTISLLDKIDNEQTPEKAIRDLMLVKNTDDLRSISIDSSTVQIDRFLDKIRSMKPQYFIPKYWIEIINEQENYGFWIGQFYPERLGSFLPEDTRILKKVVGEWQHCLSCFEFSAFNLLLNNTNKEVLSAILEDKFNDDKINDTVNKFAYNDEAGSVIIKPSVFREIIANLADEKDASKIEKVKFILNYLLILKGDVLKLY